MFPSDIFIFDDIDVVDLLCLPNPLDNFIKPAGLDYRALDQLVRVGEANCVGGGREEAR